MPSIYDLADRLNISNDDALAYAAHTQPHPAHLAIAFVIAWALLEVCIDIYHKEKNK